jgi:hypothetical protein
VQQSTGKLTKGERERDALHLAYALARQHAMRIVAVTEGYVVYWAGDRHGRRRDPVALLRLVRRLIQPTSHAPR